MMRTILNRILLSYPAVGQNLFVKYFSTSANVCSGYKRYDREHDAIRISSPSMDDLRKDDGTSLDFDMVNRIATFPTLETHSQLFDGVKYTDLPIVHIRATSNNTIIVATEATGRPLALQSAGTVGFRNCKKSTNVAAQAVAIALAGEALRKDVRTVRVCLKGIGPGRLAALKALQQSGLNIVSITDTTPLAHNGNRPKKVRRL